MTPGWSATVGSLVFGPVQLDAPWWLLVWPIAVGLTLWFARRSLSGLSGRVRVTAIAARVLLLSALVLVLCEPQVRDEGRDVAVTVVLDVSRSVPTALQQQAARYVERAGEVERAGSGRLGVVTSGREAFVQSLPSARTERVERVFVGSPDGTDLAAGVRLALAVRPPDAAMRILLASDGNETSGSLLEAAESARAAGVPIDVLPLVRELGTEVVLERVVAPATARVGETIAVRPVLVATRPARGRLSLLANGEPMPIGPDGARSVPIELDEGVNVRGVQILALEDGPQVYEAVFEPDGPEDDTIIENNRALAVTFVAGEGRVLLLRENPRESLAIEAALRASGVGVAAMSGRDMPSTLTELNRYDAVVMVNQGAWDYTERQQVMLRNYVHDSGGGLVKVGGDQAFGAGGWIGSALEDALPVQLDPPQRRNMPMGALALVIDCSGSMAMPVQGTGMNQQELANEAAVLGVQTLTRLDQVMVIAFSGGSQIVVPLTFAADQAGIARRIRAIGPGGGTNMFPAIDLAAAELAKSPAGVKHIIVLTDGVTIGDPHRGVQRASEIFQRGITISTLSIGDAADDTLLAHMARAGGGRFYNVRSQNAQALLPQIFVKEAQTVRRSLIWEGDPVSPLRTGAPSEALRGVGGVPPVRGYIVTAPRDGLALVTLRSPVEDDPLAAQWQYGLGRVFVLMTDAGARWADAWQEWGGFGAFWAQHVRWAMRPSGSADVRVVTETRGERTRFIVEAFTPEGERLPFADFRGRITTPDGDGRDLVLRQVGPGRWEGSVETGEAGTYVASLQYAAPPVEGRPALRGSAQAAITRPFSDEFRALEANVALLRQVAAATGGRVLGSDPSRAELWSRDGLTMPVATRAIWAPLALAALALLLIDVGVRRVRLDPAVLGSLLRRAAARERAKAGAQMEALSAARAKARAKIQKQRVAPPPEPTGTGDVPPLPIPGASAPIANETEPGASDTKTRQAPESEEGLGRLLQAKRRTRGDLDSTG